MDVDWKRDVSTLNGFENGKVRQEERARLGKVRISVEVNDSSSKDGRLATQQQSMEINAERPSRRGLRQKILVSCWGTGSLILSLSWQPSGTAVVGSRLHFEEHGPPLSLTMWSSGPLPHDGSQGELQRRFVPVHPSRLSNGWMEGHHANQLLRR